VDRIADLVDTPRGKVSPRPIEDALHGLPEVELAVAYGVAAPDGQAEVPVAVVVLRSEARLRPQAVTAALEVLAPHQRPEVIQVVDSIPMTDGFRPLRGPLRARGMPSGSCLRWNAGAGRYESSGPVYTRAAGR
jgi:putative long chain acyl-CoA synthase